MFETLTAFLPRLQSSKYGKWIIDRENDGSPDHPIRFPFVAYDKTVIDFEKTAYRFVDEHKEMELTNYDDILKKAGLEWGSTSMENADVSALDGRTVMALIIGAIRADRFCDGVLLDFFKKGCIKKWLLRLKEIDEQ